MILEIRFITSLKGKERKKVRNKKKSEKGLTCFFHDFNKMIISNS